MRPTRMALLLLIIAWSAIATAEEPVWRDLFNGKDLSGWKANMHPESFSVVDGVIKAHGKNGMAHFLYVGSDEQSANWVNFELEAIVRGEPNSNSGIFFHTNEELRRGKYLNKGYEVQLNSTAKEKKKTGSLYGVVDLSESPVDETEWFAIRFRVQGERIQVWIDNKQVVDYLEPDDPVRTESRAKRLLDPRGGAIALQAHDPKSVFYFKSIRMRRL